MCTSIPQKKRHYLQSDFPLGLQNILTCALLVGNLFLTEKAHAWGFAAHRKVIDLSIQLLPPSVHPFFKIHRDWLVEHALDADLRKHSLLGESERHFIDLDLYLEEITWKEIQALNWMEAKEIWGEATLRQQGIGPWHVMHAYTQLILAFEEDNQAAILRQSVDLAHYVSDLHVPLHTTSNYDGQQTGQDGIHAFWETQLPEFLMLKGLEISPHHQVVQSHDFIPDPSTWIWKIVESSHAELELIFHVESEVRGMLNPSEIYAYVERGRTRQKMRSNAFVEQSLLRLDHQVENRLYASAHAVASIWYSAWIAAGQPNLNVSKKNQSIFKACIDWIIR